MKELIEKYLNGEVSDTERTELLDSLRSDSRVEGWLRADMEFADDTMPEPVKQRVLTNILEAEHITESFPLGHRRLWRRLFHMGIAACLVGVVGICSWGGWWWYNHSRVATPAPVAMGDIVVTTGMGEHSRLTLPDGTEVTLNALTTLRYNTMSEHGERRVDIVGEAFFDVARDEKHPFVVHAGDLKVECLGTAFDVRNYEAEDNIAVVLSEGKVRVSTNESNLTMEPNSRVLFDRQTLAFSKHIVPASDYTLWLHGEIRYNNQTLEEIAAELSRNYNISVVITSDSLKTERFSGYLGRSSLRNVLDVLCLASNISYYVDGDTSVFVYPRKRQ